MSDRRRRALVVLAFIAFTLCTPAAASAHSAGCADAYPFFAYKQTVHVPPFYRNWFYNVSNGLTHTHAPCWYRADLH
jgi:hypothetical protein